MTGRSCLACGGRRAVRKPYAQAFMPCPECQSDAAKRETGLLRELQLAHRIISNALAVMTTEQKCTWGERNAADSCDGEGITRANERAEVIGKHGGSAT